MMKHNPKVEASRDAKLAEIIIEELDKLNESYNKVVNVSQRSQSDSLEIRGIVSQMYKSNTELNQLIEHLSGDNKTISATIRTIQMQKEQYHKLLEIIRTMHNNIIVIHETGFKLSKQSVDNLLASVKSANIPIYYMIIGGTLIQVLIFSIYTMFK